MRNRSVLNRRINIMNTIFSIFVFGTGLILFFGFHVGHGWNRLEWLGLEKEFWLNIHRVSAVAFISGFAVHIQRHRKYISTVAGRWKRAGLKGKIRSNVREQILMLVVAVVVVWAGFYAWAAMPEATLEVETFHRWIDVHNISGLAFLVGMCIHVWRRRRRIFLTPAEGGGKIKRGMS